ncbi:hypothetical protein [Thiomonas sp.]|jgi:membrane protein implicated in regulation of membrane protease activity|uniref:NfeD family protein n=1 Tax=Thiomonas sp. TaxID=2047785 RepID=UPI0025884B91|nr:hypothetical protein [Thiomonas sp.]
MDNPTAWWILAGFFVAMELVSGTFYLLMLAVGAVAGALAAHAGLPMPWHWVAHRGGRRRGDRVVSDAAHFR